jgi:hypothetical protein
MESEAMIRGRKDFKNAYIVGMSAFTELAALTTNGAHITRGHLALGRCELPEKRKANIITYPRDWALHGPGVPCRDVSRLSLEVQRRLERLSFFWKWHRMISCQSKKLPSRWCEKPPLQKRCVCLHHKSTFSKWCPLQHTETRPDPAMTNWHGANFENSLGWNVSLRF